MKRPVAVYNGTRATHKVLWGRGFQYGDGVFRTCLIYHSEVIDLKNQVSKLLEDAKVLGLAVPGPRTLSAECRALAAGRRSAVLKVYLLRSAGRRADRLLVVHPLVRRPASNWTVGISVRRSAVRLGYQPELAGIKHMNRLHYLIAERERKDGIDEVLVSDDRGRPLEGTRSNLFWVKKGVLHTPRLDRGGVAGVVRASVLAHAARLGMAARVRQASWRDLESADEAFVCNSVVGIWPIRRFEGRRWKAPGPVTRRLAAALRHPRQVAA